MMPLIGRLKLIPAILSEHLSLILLPIRLSVEHPLDGLIWLENLWNLFAIAILVGMATSVWFAWKMNRLIFFGLIWLCVGFLPVLNLFPLAVPILEHRLYTVIVGPVFILGSVIIAMRIKYSKNILIILIIAAALTSYLRSPIWQNSETLWRDAMQKAPTAHRPYFNLAGYYYDRQQFDKTIILLNKYIEIKPEDYTGYSKLRQTYYAIGDYEKVLQVCRKMISLAPHDPNRYIDLGIFFEKLNLPDSAIGVYSEGLRVDSTFYQLHVHLGRMYHNQNNLAEAKKHYRLAIQLKSDFAPAYFSLGVLEASQGNDSLALQLLEQGVKFEQPSADIKQAILYLREKTGYDWK
jgi:tetratricopeptide (TPR) repeat protein